MPDTQRTRRLPLANFSEYHPWPSVRSMRNRVHAARTKDEDPEFLECIEWCAGRVLVNEQKFLRWLETRAERDTLARRESNEAA